MDVSKCSDSFILSLLTDIHVLMLSIVGSVAFAVSKAFILVLLLFSYLFLRRNSSYCEALTCQ